MTENEKEIKVAIEHFKAGNMSAKHIDMAIQALEEVQQYREIGMSLEVVEEFKRMDKENDGELTAIVKSIKELGQYRAIDTVEKFKTLKEKNVAKKPDYEGDGYDNMGQIVLDTWICPNCEKHYEVDYDDYDYCPNCGPHIDHSGLTKSQSR